VRAFDLIQMVIEAVNARGPVAVFSALLFQAVQVWMCSMTQTKLDLPFSTLINLIILVLVVYVILPPSWTDPLLYETEYQIAKNQVHWHYRPTDCDFMHAPVGNNGCSYKKIVTAYNAAGEAVEGDNAPKYATNTHGDITVSHDDGKTWETELG
jgi:hypothetical protein